MARNTKRVKSLPVAGGAHLEALIQKGQQVFGLKGADWEFSSPADQVQSGGSDLCTPEVAQVDEYFQQQEGSMEEEAVAMGDEL